MAKKKAKAGSGRANTRRKKAARKTAKTETTRKKVTRRKATRKKAVRRASKLVKKKKVARKTARRAGVKRAAKAPRKVAARAPAARPKRPRRTKQAMPPTPRPITPPVLDVEPLAPPPIIPPSPATGEMGLSGGSVVEPEGGPLFSSASLFPPGPCVGEPAPDFTLRDEQGRTHTLSQYLGQKVVLYFYPKDDTPGCTTEACGFRDRLGGFTDRNAVVLGVSPDSVESHQRFAQKYGLTFPLLADEGHRVAERYGVWVEKKRYGATTMGIARTTFVIDPDGRIGHVFRDVRPDGHEQEVLQRLGP